MPTKFSKLPPFERLSELLTYDPEDGQLRWKINRSNVKSGGTAGCIRTTRNGRREWITMVDGKLYISVRIIWKLYHRQDPGSLSIDHVNRNTLDNRIANLRLATAHEQALNMSITSTSTATRYLGLSMNSNKNSKGRPRWNSNIRVAGHLYSFGSVTVNSINDPAPQWLIDRAARLYSMRDDPAITDEDLIKEITRVRCNAFRRR